MSGLTLEDVRAALARSPVEIAGEPQTRRAAVAAIFHQPPGGMLEVLFIRRAERPSDPWSGHIAFPGGRMDDSDPDLRATVVRETSEEIGLDLDANGELLGRLDDIVPGTSRGLLTSLVVTPFVWWVPERPVLVPSGVEVDEIHWVAIDPLMRGERDTTLPYVWRGQTLQFPGYRIGELGGSERVVWGMTHRMLQLFFGRLEQLGLSGNARL